MNNEYIIVNKTKVLEEIEDLKASLNYIPESYIPKHLAQIYAYEQVLLKSTPLIPEIENAFDEGQNRMQHEIIEKLGLRYQTEQISHSTILNMEVHSEDYISNLKLDI
jgi:hypothetical protein